MVLLCHAHGRCCPDTLIPHLPDHMLVWSLENSRTTGAPSRPEKPASGSEMEPAGGTADLSVSPSPEASGKAIPQPGILGEGEETFVLANASQLGILSGSWFHLVWGGLGLEVKCQASLPYTPKPGTSERWRQGSRCLWICLTQDRMWNSQQC